MRIASELAVIAVLAVSGAAAAQPSETSAAATAEFDRGRTLMKEEKFEQACAAFERSQKLEAAPGTLYNLAGCYVHIGKLASAWAAFRELAQRDSNAGRRADAARQAAELEPRLPRLALSMREKPAGLVVMLDGVDVTAGVGASDLPVDLGAREVTASAPGYKPWRATARIAAERSRTSLAIELVEAPVVEEEQAPPRSSRRTYAAIVGVGGVALIGTGLVFGELSRRKWAAAKELCPDLGCSSDADFARASQLLDDARLRANVATGLAIGGGVAVGIAAVLWLTAPTTQPQVALFVGDAWGASVQGTF